jgi:hypothetical protein
VHRRFWWGILTERDNSDMGVDRWNIWKWISRQMDGTAWNGLNWLRIGQVASVVNTVMNIRVP